VSEPIDLEARQFVCSCGHSAFQVEISNGVDGKTMALWLRCTKCHFNNVYRRPMRAIEGDN